MKAVTEVTRSSANISACNESLTRVVASRLLPSGKRISTAKQSRSAIGIICTLRAKNINTPKAMEPRPKPMVKCGCLKQWLCILS